jgi:CheY-like chemotaxis protein
MNNSKLVVLVEPELKEVLLFEWAMKRLHVRNPVRVMQKTRELREYLEGEGPYRNRELFPLPRVILMDLDLPGLEAANFLYWLRHESDCGDIPLIGVSNFEVSRRVQAFYDLGMNAFFQKRINLDDTLRCMRELELLDDVFERDLARMQAELEA